MNSYFNELADKLETAFNNSLGGTTEEYDPVVMEAVGVLRTLAGCDDEPKELPAVLTTTEPYRTHDPEQADAGQAGESPRRASLCTRLDCHFRLVPPPSNQKGFLATGEH